MSANTNFHARPALAERARHVWRWGVDAVERGARAIFAPVASPVAGADPSASLFHGIQRKLILWYCGVLAALLLLAGALLYFGMRQTLIGQVDYALTETAGELSAQWSESGQAPYASPFYHGPRNPYLIACYDTQGAFVSDNVSASNPLYSKFLAPSLASNALANGSAGDVIDGGPGVGTIRRYAVAVHDASGNTLGVVQIGAPFEGATEALNALLTLLLLVGGLTLLGSAAGGLWLAGRALAPARLAFTRQQRFIADASHELRTPLTLLRADAEVLLRGRERFAADDVELLEDIVGETHHLSSLATNLLTLARLDSGAIHPERELVDLAALARRLIHRAQAFAGERRITLTLDPASQPALVVGDPALLEQAALILLDNAIKYNRPNGSVTLRATRARGEAALEVRDTGPGVAPEQLPHLGERFYRPDKARSREAGGAGLGISIARGIAALHQGTLTLASPPGQGTSVTLRLPAAPVGGSVAEPASA